MSQLPDTSCSEPLDEATYRHHLLLVKSAHCTRPVQHEGKNHFISALSMNRAGGRWDMLVYLAGNPAAIDSAEITIKTDNNNERG